MIRSFRNTGTRDIAKGLNTKAARIILPTILHPKARRKLAEIDFAKNTDDLRHPGNRFHILTGNRKGQISISINDQYRICFTWFEGDAINVEILDYH